MASGGGGLFGGLQAADKIGLAHAQLFGVAAGLVALLFGIGQLLREGAQTACLPEVEADGHNQGSGDKGSGGDEGFHAVFSLSA